MKYENLTQICSKNEEQKQQQKSEFQKLGIGAPEEFQPLKILVSPFLRTLQTAAYLNLGMTKQNNGKIFIGLNLSNRFSAKKAAFFEKGQVIQKSEDPNAFLQ